MVSGLIKSVITVIFSAIVVQLFYDFSIFSLGWMIAPAYIMLLLFGWGMGMLVLSLIFRFSTQVQSLSWSIVFLVQPLSGVFYPISVLPAPLRTIGQILPTSYIFSSVNEYVNSGKVIWHDIGIGLVLSCVYFLLGFLVLQRSFRQAKSNGALARLEGCG